MRSLKNSLFLAVSSCALSILIGTAGAVGMAKSRFRAQNLLENVSLIPMMLPEIILAWRTFRSSPSCRCRSGW